MRRRLFRSLDGLLGGVCAEILSLHRRLIGNENSIDQQRPIQKILLTKLIGLGDLILLQTVLHYIRNALPATEIHFLTTPACAMVFTENFPYVDAVRIEDISRWKNPLIDLLRLARELRTQRYDGAIDFEQHFHLTPILLYLSNIPRRAGFYYCPERAKLFTDPIQISPCRHMLLDFLKLAHTLIPYLNVSPERLVSPVLTNDNRKNAFDWLDGKGLKGKPYVVIHPGCGPSGLCRAWPMERFADISLRLSQKGYAILLSGTSEERAIVDFIISKQVGSEVYSLVDKLSFYDYAALLDNASLLLSNDTGPLHLGAALRVPTLGLFGPENPQRYKPYGGGNDYLYIAQQCSPCNHNYKGIRPKCTNNTYQKCMLEISVDMVEEKVMEVLSRS